MVDVPLIRIAGELDRDDVIHVHADATIRAIDLNVFFLDRKAVFSSFGQDGLADDPVVVGPGRLTS